MAGGNRREENRRRSCGTLPDSHSRRTGRKRSSKRGQKGTPLPTADWIKALLAVRESCELRGDGRPGSRAYLDFPKDFIGQTN